MKRAERAGIDIGGVMETVGHRVEPGKREPEPRRLVSEDRLYRAEFGPGGFSLTLRRKLSAVGLAARERAWRATHPPEPQGARSKEGQPAMPTEAIPFDREPAFRVETARVLRGGAPLALAPGGWHAERNSARRSLGPRLAERVTAREGKLEWDLLLARPPAGRGALRIEARVSAAGAADHVSGSRPAWTFPAGAGRSVTVGALVVRDARGREVHRALPVLQGGRLSLTVPGEVLDGSAYPIVIDPVISPEYPVSDPVSGRAPGDQNDPAVAFDGTNYLVVWGDGRAGLPTSGVYGARVSRQGAVLDKVGIQITTDANHPSLAFNGTNYLVVWEDYRSADSADIYGARVTRTGTVLDLGGIPISTAAHDQVSPSLAFDGTNYLVTWGDHRSGTWPNSDVYGARVDPVGGVLDPGGIAISTAAGGQFDPALGFDGTNYLVVWGDGRSGAADLYGARVNQAGTVLDPSGISISTAANDQFDPSLAFDGTNYLVAWQDSRSTPYTYRVYGARVTPAGTVLDPAGIAISPTVYDHQQSALAFDGTNYLVVWRDCCRGALNDIYGSRVSRTGTVLDPGGIAISRAINDQDSPALAFDGTNYLVVWEDGRSGPRPRNFDTYGARVSPAGSVLDVTGIVLSTAANEQRSPDIAFDGTNYLVVWQDYRAGGLLISGARATQAGVPLDGTGIQISGPNAYDPAVAFDGTNYLVVWSYLDEYCDEYKCYRKTAIFGSRVSPAGAVLDEIAVAQVASDDVQTPALAFDGTNYLVVWCRGSSSDIFGARVDRAGHVLDPDGIAISTAGGTQVQPAVAFGGTNYLVVWQDRRSNPDGHIYGTRVSRAGSVLDPSGIAISTAADEWLSALAFDDTNYLVVWMDSRSDPAFDIYGTRVSPAGTVLDPAGIAISTAASRQDQPALGFDGTNYLVAWADYRSGRDIYGARVSRGGSVLDPSGIAIAAAGGSEDSPAVTRGAYGGRVAVAYRRFAPEAPYGASRVFMRFVYLPSVLSPTQGGQAPRAAG